MIHAAGTWHRISPIPALRILHFAFRIDFIQKLSLNSCRKTKTSAQKAEKRNAKRKTKSHCENCEKTGKTVKMAATTPAIIWLIKDCMPKIANANGWKGEGVARNGIKVKSDTLCDDLGNNNTAKNNT